MRPPANSRTGEPATAAAPLPLAGLLFAATIGLGALLLFSVQPLLGKRLLPWFGGTSALWTTCLLFFQTALVSGYLWAHGLAAHGSLRRPRALHLALAAAALLLLGSRWNAWPAPILPAEPLRPGADEPPLLGALLLLARAAGLPVVLLAASSPLLSAWYAQGRMGGDPFRLYAVSNAASLLGLVGYPLLLEPLASLPTQGWLWSLGFVAYCVGLAACALISARPRSGHPTPAAPAPDPAEPGPTAGARLLWLVLAMVPSLLLAAITSHLTQEVAPVPLLWMIPLALYLVSFVICFGRPALGSRAVWAPATVVALALAVLALLRAVDLGTSSRVLVWSFVLLACSMACHGELVRRQPPSRHLTAFYLHVAAGGALGSGFCAVLAPRLFDGYLELHLGLFLVPLVLGASWVAAVGSAARSGDPALELRIAIGAAVAVVGLGAALGLDAMAAGREPVLARRGFHGVLRVVRERPGQPDEHLTLLHGRVAHGMQLTAPQRRREITTYFGPTSGAGLAIARHPRRLAGQSLQVGVIGLGVGTLAAWSLPGDRFRFYELAPEVAALSQGEHALFTYLREARGVVEVRVADGRLALEREPPQGFDVLVLDAFSSGAIPTHLLTREAFRVYERHLAEGAVLAVQVTNRHLDLKPVVRGVAAELGLAAVHVPSHERGHLWSSDWMLLARDRWIADDEVLSAASLPPPPGSRRVVWTDDWSDLMSVVRR